MLRTSIKWGLGLAVAVLAVLAVLAFTGKKTFHVEIAIPAPPAAVWAVLTDTGRYADWNPVFVRVDGEYRAGAAVKSTVKEPGKPPVVMASEVRRLVPERELNQVGGIFGFITFDHRWLLEPADGGTKVTQHEVDRGLWLWFWDSDWVEPAYRKASEALRARVLSLRND